MTKQISVLGTGANGSSVAADLTRAGLDVTLIDQWPAHVEQMKADGLAITTPNDTLRVACGPSICAMSAAEELAAWPRGSRQIEARRRRPASKDPNGLIE